MRSLAPLLALGLVLSTAPSQAASPPVQAHTFQVLHSMEGSTIGAEGLEIHMVEGRLSVKAARLQADGLVLEDVTMAAPITVDDAFFAAPVTGMVTALLEQGDLHVARLSHAQSNLYTLTNVAMRFRGGELLMTGRKVVNVKVRGQGTWDPDTMKLQVEVESIRAGIVPVSKTVVFAAMARILTLPFVELDKPFLRMDLASFLR